MSSSLEPVEEAGAPKSSSGRDGGGMDLEGERRCREGIGSGGDSGSGEGIGLGEDAGLEGSGEGEDSLREEATEGALWLLRWSSSSSSDSSNTISSGGLGRFFEEEARIRLDLRGVVMGEATAGACLIGDLRGVLAGIVAGVLARGPCGVLAGVLCGVGLALERVCRSVRDAHSAAHHEEDT